MRAQRTGRTYVPSKEDKVKVTMYRGLRIRWSVAFKGYIVTDLDRDWPINGITFRTRLAARKFINDYLGKPVL
jgi:hypothetical protein